MKKRREKLNWVEEEYYIFTYENNINTDLLEREDKEALNMYLEYGYM